MPKWTTAIPEDPKGPALPIRRTPAFKKMLAIITSEDLIGTNTHYFKGRTRPCEGPGCEAHLAGIPFRWHAYVAAEDIDTALHFIFETTAMGAEPFIQYREHHNTLRGCLFQAQRWKQRPNGRILIRCKPADLKDKRLPPAPDMIKCLSILWDLPSTDLDAGGRNPEKRTQEIVLPNQTKEEPCDP